MTASPRGDLAGLAATAAGWIREADRVVIGAGAGLSAAAGLDYADRAEFAAHFPALVRRGIRAAYEMIGRWDLPPEVFWGYWAVHVEQKRFADGRSPVYECLRGLVGDTDHFVLTSNVDAMFVRNGFDADRVWSIQGDYAFMQCLAPCSTEVWPSKPVLDRARAALEPATQAVADPGAVPRCIRCGGPVFMNVRGGRWFLEEPYVAQRQRWQQWFSERPAERLVVLDIGSGYNTPGVIRWPMEGIAQRVPAARLVRVNLTDARVPRDLSTRAVSIQADAREALEAIAGSAAV